MSARGESQDIPLVRILALHGSEGTGPDFIERLEPLRGALNRDNLNVQITALTAPFSKGAGFAWWTIPPGVRSFTATEYEGFETSVALTLDTLQQQGPFDLILGHSQGAILLSALLALKRIPSHPKMGYILNGVAVPNPFKSELEQLQILPGGENDIVPRVLFIVGENDRINPKTTAETVKTCMERAGLQVSACYHPRGHSVPVEDANVLRVLADWVLEGLE